MESPIKVILVGDSGVGKTCLMIRLISDKFTPSHYNTIGIDFKVKRMQYQDSTYVLQIYDTAGQERFKTLSKAYYRGAHAVILVYDVTVKESLSNLEEWVREVEAICPESTIRILLGNKQDMPHESLNPAAKLLADRLAAEVFEVSALTGEGVAEAFEYLVAEVVKEVHNAVGGKLGERISLGMPGRRGGYCCL